MTEEKHGAAFSALIADDDAFFQIVLTEMLEQLGIAEVHTADNGADALRVLKGLSRPPDVVICDVFMPDMDGMEFLGQLAARKFAGGVITVSGVDAQMLDLSRMIARDSGLSCLGAFVKPVTLEQLGAALGRPLP